MISNTFDILLSSLISPRKQKRFLTSVLSNHPATEDCEKCFPTPTPNDIPESIKRSSGCHQFGKLRCQQLSPSLPATVDWQQLFLCRRPETSSWHTEKERVNVCVCDRERGTENDGGKERTAFLLVNQITRICVKKCQHQMWLRQNNTQKKPPW